MLIIIIIIIMEGGSHCTIVSMPNKRCQRLSEMAVWQVQPRSVSRQLQSLGPAVLKAQSPKLVVGRVWLDRGTKRNWTGSSPHT